MCTAISYRTKDHYFGRNLDLEYNYHEEVVISPRNTPLPFRSQAKIEPHYAIIGIATVSDDYPLYYDATNEFGLSMAGLNFPGNAVYQAVCPGKTNIASFEFIPWILGQCKTIDDAKEQLKNIRLTDVPFNQQYPPSPLHWIIADKNASVVVEPMADGLIVYDNPTGVLTNNPPFEYHLYNLSNYLNLTNEEPNNRFSDTLHIQPFSRGMGAIGLPGDLSSASRFVRAVFTKFNSVSSETETENVSQFFHILTSVEQQKGCVLVDGKYEKTVYSSCCNTDKCIYYYKTYNNSQITAVGLFNEDLTGHKLIRYPLVLTQNILEINRK